MSSLSVSVADAIYQCCGEQQISISVVEHDGVRMLANELRRLERALGDVAAEQYWEELLRPFRRYRFRISAMPLPFNSPLMVPADLISTIEKNVPNCASVYPEHFAHISAIANLSRDLAVSAEAPLLECLKSQIEKHVLSPAINRWDDHTPPINKTQTCVLLRGQADTLTKQFLREQLNDPTLQLSDASSLLNLGTIDHLILIGPLTWFPRHVQTAPRSHHLSIIRYQWLSDVMRPSPSLITSDPKTMFLRPINLQPVTTNDADHSLLDLLPMAHWSMLSNKIEQQWQDDNVDERVSCKLFLLSKSSAVYLETSADAKFPVIKLGAVQRLQRLTIDELEPGLFLLLRTEGGGDLIEPIANQLLGDQAMPIQESQKKWKQALVELVRQKGEVHVIHELIALGCKRASDYNLRNWMGKNSIRPDYDDDFLSILVLCSLDAEEIVIVQNAKLLDRAHRAAGFTIRKRLLKRVEQINLEAMADEGSAEIQLPGAIGGSFTSYRIQEISPEVYQVPISRLNHPFRLENSHG